MTNDWMLGSLYLLMAIMLVGGSLIARRETLDDIVRAECNEPLPV